VRQGQDLASALVTEMTPPSGALHQECRFDYHLLMERSRGRAAVRSILHHLARHEGAILSDVARHLRVALPTALDDRSWLLEVGLIRRDGRGYVLTDPLLRLWIVLNGPDPNDLTEQVALFLGEPRQVVRPPARPRGRRAGAAPSASPPAPRRAPGSDPLMEID
ncbi:MAG: hypothetical protein ACE5JH_12710, partial [Acidobacteriota bacterium]